MGRWNILPILPTELGGNGHEIAGAGDAERKRALALSPKPVVLED